MSKLKEALVDGLEDILRNDIGFVLGLVGIAMFFLTIIALAILSNPYST